MCGIKTTPVDGVFCRFDSDVFWSVFCLLGGWEVQKREVVEKNVRNSARVGGGWIVGGDWVGVGGVFWSVFYGMRLKGLCIRVLS